MIIYFIQYDNSNLADIFLSMQKKPFKFSFIIENHPRTFLFFKFFLEFFYNIEIKTTQDLYIYLKKLDRITMTLPSTKHYYSKIGIRGLYIPKLPFNLIFIISFKQINIKSNREKD